MSRTVLATSLVMLSGCVVANPFASLDTGSSTDTTETQTQTGSESAEGTESGSGESGDGPKLDIPDDETSTGGEDCVENIDVVFVMDVSTTMGPFFDVLEQEIAAVHDVIESYDLPEPPHYGLVVFVDDYTFVNAGVAYADIGILGAEFTYWNEFTANNRQTTTATSNTTFPENSLDALFVAAADFDWRAPDNTLRMIVHTTDDTFWNGPTTGNGVAIQHSYAETVEVMRAGEVRMFTFAAALGGPSGNLDVSMGFFTDFEGQAPIPDQTGGGAYDIDEVLAGTASIAEQLGIAIEDSYCEDYPPIG